MDKNIAQVLYLVDLIAAVALFLKCSQNLLQGWDQEQSESILNQLQIHRINMMLRFVQLFLIILGKVSGKPLKFASQFIDRAFLVIIFLSPLTDRFQYLCLALLYSLVDSVKYLYQLQPKYQILATLKYNLPLITNIFIPLLSISLMSNYIKINAQTISYEAVNGIRLMQLGYLVHGGINYKIILNEKREFEKSPAKMKES